MECHVRVCFTLLKCHSLSFQSDNRPWNELKMQTLKMIFWEDNRLQPLWDRLKQPNLRSNDVGLKVRFRRVVSKFPMWGFPKIRVPQNGWFIMENPIKMGWFGGTTIFGNTHVSQGRFVTFFLFFGGGWQIPMTFSPSPEVVVVFRSDPYPPKQGVEVQSPLPPIEFGGSKKVRIFGLDGCGLATKNSEKKTLLFLEPLKL